MIWGGEIHHGGTEARRKLGSVVDLLEAGFFEGDGADVFAGAGAAAVAFPELIKLVADGFDHGGTFGPDAHFEVAAFVALGTESGAREIRTA